MRAFSSLSPLFYLKTIFPLFFPIWIPFDFVFFSSSFPPPQKKYHFDNFFFWKISIIYFCILSLCFCSFLFKIQKQTNILSELLKSVEMSSGWAGLICIYANPGASLLQVLQPCVNGKSQSYFPIGRWRHCRFYFDWSGLIGHRPPSSFVTGSGAALPGWFCRPLAPRRGKSSAGNFSIGNFQPGNQRVRTGCVRRCQTCGIPWDSRAG